MTYNEKLREVAPDFIHADGEPMFCPCFYFELHDPNCVPAPCSACWNREYQGEPVKMKNIERLRWGLNCPHTAG